jgi:hypothetical protein
MKHITVRKRCPLCDGEMIGTGSGFSNNIGTQWEHKCSKCGNRAHFAAVYPLSYNEYEPEEMEDIWEDANEA